jgi:hypothetical protein
MSWDSKRRSTRGELPTTNSESTNDQQMMTSK